MDHVALSHLSRLIEVVRAAGVRISSSEALDAAAAMRVLPWQSRAAVKAGLSAVLIKRAQDRPVYSAIFDAYFAQLAAMSDPRRAPGPGDDSGQGLPMPSWLVEAAKASGPVAAYLADGTAGGLGAAVQSAAESIGLDGATSPLQQGLMSYRLADALGIEAMVAQLHALYAETAAAGGDHDGEVPAWIRQALDARAKTLRELARAVTRAALAMRRPAEQRMLATSALAERPFSQMGAAELRHLEAQVAALAKRLAGRLAMARRSRTPRTLDMHRTMRKSLSTGGVPMRLVWRRRPPTKPRLIVLCDVSDSVRNASRFMLSLAHAMAARFDRVSSFVFVSQIGEVSDLFAQCDANEALRRIFAGEAVNLFSSSNYGGVFEAFWQRHHGLVTSRTTVLILGDGRTNDHPPRADLLARMQARARKVYWLNPENPALWGFGDSAMRAYVPIVDGAHCVANLSSLGAFIDALDRNPAR